MTEIMLDQRDSQHDYYPENYILCFIVFLKLVLCMTMPGEREYLPEQQQRIQKIAVNVSASRNRFLDTFHANQTMKFLGAFEFIG